MRSRYLFLAMAVFVVGVFGYAALAPHPRPAPPAARPEPTGTTAAPSATPAAYDVAALRAPRQEYLGVALSGVPQDMSRVDAYAKAVGKRPNIITIYESFDDSFAAAEVRKIYQYGALPIVRWEPFKARLADIARGRHDAYIADFAAAVRELNLPIALTVAHEMNGHWYPWGAHENRASDFVAAWRRIHRLFRAAEATNVIWTWTPNVINPVRHVRLAPLYPGDAYVDWIGLDGYFTHRGEQTFAELFGPTIREVQRFTRRPFLVVETGSEPGTIRPRAIENLFTSVAKAAHVIGFVYFNQRGSADWAIDADEAALAVYRAQARNPRFGFTVR